MMGSFKFPAAIFLSDPPFELRRLFSVFERARFGTVKPVRDEEKLNKTLRNISKTTQHHQIPKILEGNKNRAELTKTKGNEKGQESTQEKEDKRRTTQEIDSNIGIGIWNINTLTGKDMELVEEMDMDNNKIHILGISETKKKGNGIIRITNKHTRIMYYSGVKAERTAKGNKQFFSLLAKKPTIINISMSQ